MMRVALIVQMHTHKYYGTEYFNSSPPVVIEGLIHDVVRGLISGLVA